MQRHVRANSGYPLTSSQVYAQAVGLETPRSRARAMLSDITQTFRQRFTCWKMSALSIGVGATILENGDALFKTDIHAPQFAPLQRIIENPNTWGVLMICIGLTRLTALFFNSYLPEKSWPFFMRAACCMFTMLVWLQVLIGTASFGPHWSTATSIYLALVASEIFAVYTAMADLDTETGGVR